MVYSVNSLCDKDVVNVNDGVKIGTVGDVEFDSETGKITSLTVLGKSGFMGFMGKTENIKINWCDIEIIGNDTILVKYN